MNRTLKYSIDTSALIDGWGRYYPVSTFPGLWTKLSELIEQGDLQATEEVKYEIEKKDDQLIDWCNQFADFFVPMDLAIQNQVSELLSVHPDLVDAGKGRSGADPFVIVSISVQKGHSDRRKKATRIADDGHPGRAELIYAA